MNILGFPNPPLQMGQMGAFPSLSAQGWPTKPPQSAQMPQQLPVHVPQQMMPQQLNVPQPLNMQQQMLMQQPGFAQQGIYNAAGQPIVQPFDQMQQIQMQPQLQPQLQQQQQPRDIPAQPSPAALPVQPQAAPPAAPQAKGARAPPSGDTRRVIMVRKVPVGTTEDEIEEWLQGHVFQSAQGIKAVEVTAVVLSDKDRAAWGEMATPEMAQSLVSQSNAGGGLVFKRKQLAVQMSNKNGLVVKKTAELVPAPQAPPSRIMMLYIKRSSEKDKQSAGRVYLDEVFWMCTQFGKVEKMSEVRPQKRGGSEDVDETVRVQSAQQQVLVQYERPDACLRATQHLDGTAITYNGKGMRGECSVNASPAKVQELTFTSETEHRRDCRKYNEQIQSHMPDKIGELKKQTGWKIRDVVWETAWVPGGQYDPLPGRNHSSPLADLTDVTVLKLSGLPLDAEGNDRIVSARVLFKVAAIYGEIMAVKMCYRAKGCSLLQFKGDVTASFKYMKQLHLFGKRCTIVQSHHQNATNWANSEVKSLLYTVEDEPNPRYVSRKDQMFVPSSRVIFHSLPKWVEGIDIRGVVETALKKYKKFERCTLIKNIQQAAGGYVLDMQDSDTAFITVGLLNNETFEIRGNELYTYASFCPTGDIEDVVAAFRPPSLRQQFGLSAMSQFSVNRHASFQSSVPSLLQSVHSPYHQASFDVGVVGGSSPPLVPLGMDASVDSPLQSPDEGPLPHHLQNSSSPMQASPAVGPQASPKARHILGSQSQLPLGSSNQLLHRGSHQQLVPQNLGSQHQLPVRGSSNQLVPQNLGSQHQLPLGSSTHNLLASGRTSPSNLHPQHSGHLQGQYANPNASPLTAQSPNQAAQLHDMNLSPTSMSPSMHHSPNVSQHFHQTPPAPDAMHANPHVPQYVGQNMAGMMMSQGPMMGGGFLPVDGGEQVSPMPHPLPHGGAGSEHVMSPINGPLRRPSGPPGVHPAAAGSQHGSPYASPEQGQVSMSSARVSPIEQTLPEGDQAKRPSMYSHTPYAMGGEQVNISGKRESLMGLPAPMGEGAKEENGDDSQRPTTPMARGSSSNLQKRGRFGSAPPRPAPKVAGAKQQNEGENTQENGMSS